MDDFLRGLRAPFLGAVALLLLMLFLSIGDAHAAQYPDQGAALAACRADDSAAAGHAGAKAPQSIGNCNTPGGENSYGCRYLDNFNNPRACAYFSRGVSDSGYTWPAGKSCSSRPPLASGWAVLAHAGSSCSNGCVYGAGSGGGGSMTVGGVVYHSRAGAAPTGAVCAASDNEETPMSSEQCTQVGTLTQCVTPDGKHCAVSSSGKRFCWGASEAGTKASGNEGATKAPANTSINAPNAKPTNGGDWQAGGSGTMSSSSGGSTTNYNIQNWISSYGSQGDGTPDGSGGEGDDDGDGISVTGDGQDCSAQNFQCSDMSSVECNQLVQTWYLRCRGVNLSGGDTCESEPVCKGNASDCYISRTLWLMRCDGTDRGDGGSDAIGNGTEEIVSGEGDGTEEPDMSGISTADSEIGNDTWIEKNPANLLSGLDASGFVGGGDCPSLPSFSVGGKSFQIDLAPMCDTLRAAGVLVLALAYWLAFRIIAGQR